MLTYLGEGPSNISFPLIGLVSDPVKDGLIHSTLLSHIEVISTKDVSEFIRSELLELFTGNNLLKVIKDVVVGLAPQFEAVADVGELPDSNAVLRAELLSQEVAADLYNVHHIKLICC